MFPQPVNAASPIAMVNCQAMALGTSLQILLLIVWLPCLLWADEVDTPEAERTGLSFPCASGDVTPDGVVLWARSARPTTLRMEYGVDPALGVSQQTQPMKTVREADMTAQWVVHGLRSATAYFYRARVEGKAAGPICQFRTAPLPNQAANVRFVVGGDLGERYQPFAILDGLREKQPDFMLFQGDTVYADMGLRFARRLPEFHQRHVANRRDEALQSLLASTSVYVNWDDHEVMDNYEGSFVLAPVGQQAFLNYWPVRPYPGEARRLYRSFRWGRAVELFILDVRQYRSSKEGTMLGKAQKAWLLAQLRASTATFKFIATPVPFTNPGYDRWGGYPKERDEILAAIVANDIQGVVFLSGDVHYAAVASVPGGNGIKEFMSGALAQVTRYPANTDGLDFWYGGELTYNLIEVIDNGTKPYLDVKVIDKTHQVVHTTRIENLEN